MHLSSRRDNKKGTHKCFQMASIVSVGAFLVIPPRAEADKGQAFVIRTKNNSQLFLRLRRRPHSSQRDNLFDFLKKASFSKPFSSYSGPPPPHSRTVSLASSLRVLLALGGFAFEKTVINCFLSPTRMKERKKYGLKAARRAPQFSKR